MRLKQLLIASAFVGFSLLVLLASTMFIVSNNFEKALQGQRFSREVKNGVQELNLLTSDYLLYQHLRASEQWRKRHASLEQLLSISSNVFSVESENINVLKREHIKLIRLFERLIKAQYVRNDKVMLSRALTAQLNVTMQVMNSYADRLEASYQQELYAVAEQVFWLIIMAIVCFVIALFGIWYIVTIRSFKPLSSLIKQLPLLAEDLNYRIELSRKDEFSELAETLNALTDRLSRSLVSRHRLLVEIDKRQQSENEKKDLLEDMNNRVKQLECLYSVMETLRSEDSLEDILLQVASFIPKGWHDPSAVHCRIMLEGKAYQLPLAANAELLFHSNLLIHGQGVGSIDLFSIGQQKSLERESHLYQQESMLLDSLAINISAVIEKKKSEQELKYLAFHDPLTGLYTRRVFEQRIEDEIHRCERYQRSMSLFIVDIDLFKSVNDQYGHQAGDAVLKQLAMLLFNTVRKVDYVSRYGGEEFVIILPESSFEQSILLAERIRLAVQEERFACDELQSLNITVSIGVATYPNHADNWKALFKAADSALYEAKNNGRNRVGHASKAKRNIQKVE